MDKKLITLSTVEAPSFLLNFPTSFSSKEQNNIWMQESKPEDLIVEPEVATAQWFDLYNVIASNGLVTVLPTPHDVDLQDLVFTANLGICLDKDTVVVSNFTSTPRIGETQVGVDFFKRAGYKNVVVSPHKFEGEADLKHIRDNIYIGGYGQRSEKATYEWMEKEFGVKIIKVFMKNPYLYHLDCSIFPITKNAIMICKEMFEQKELDELAQYVELVNVPFEMARCGITNNVRLHNFILNSSDLYDLDPELDKEDYRLERAKNQMLEDICTDFGMEPMFVNLSEFMKGGALLSCCVMHLNRFSYEIDLV